jgi:hypothetical protein
MAATLRPDNRLVLTYVPAEAPPEGAARRAEEGAPSEEPIGPLHEEGAE